ncbi:MAG TPA: sigma-70 family RNA polymerase sigma factor [Vicinamibacterales bacterium]|nr:sigma-70 family RNA polymerase sigma factor [Vicinamibacterales bacterium]
MSVALEQAFADHRRFLWSLSYRMTGNAADADEIVQDTFVRAMEHPPRRMDQPLRPWLAKVAVNLSHDVLRRRRRHDYVGPWLPSPIDTSGDMSPPSHEPAFEHGRTLEDRYDLVESVSFAFLLALERLTPTQRAVLLLRDVFDYSVAETADALDLSASNVKTTHHRARQAMAEYDRERQPRTADLQQQTRDALAAFLHCLEHNDVAGVEALLAEDVRTLTDGGGEFRSALRPIVGRDKVARFYASVSQIGKGVHARLLTLNGWPGVVVDRDEVPERVALRTVVQVQLNAAGKIAQIYVISASRKLTALQQTTTA